MATTDNDGGSVSKELERLQREYRYMEVDRKSYGDLSQNVIRKQRQTIERWKKENEHLRSELAAIESQQEAEETDAVMSEKLDELNSRCEFYAGKIEAEEERMETLRSQIKLLERKIKEQREVMGGVNAAISNSQTVAKQIRVLENRLDKALVKFNSALSHNKKLREEIDNLRRERVVFDGIYRKLEKQLVEKKKRMADIIEVSNSAYDARDMAQDKMNRLKESHMRAMAQLDAEMMNMNRVLKSERRAKNFIAIKEQERANTAAGRRTRSRKNGGGGGRGGGGDAAAGVAASAAAAPWAQPKLKSSTESNAEIIQTYEEAFDKIQAATLISDIDELVSTFIEVEDQNFSLFNFVNDLQNETEKLEEQIADLRAKISETKTEGETSDAQRRHLLKSLSHKLAKTEARADQYESKYKTARKVMNNLKSAVHSIFNKIGCSSEEINDVLGDAGTTDSNIMQYLALIERRAAEIIHEVAARKLAEEDADDDYHRSKRGGLVAILSQQRVPPGGDRIVIAAPSSMGDVDEFDEESDEESQRPFTRDELKALSRKGATKKKNERSRRRGGTSRRRRQHR
ncbi:flagellar outer dynein arm-docking complex protein 1 [Thecamonas trahens ATCC 50062]|uniref:Flagellar outer dynein arm-docking complex protein 1 n=1 Tax=Thecamonas trahens ATCC 50062 TaxID=461836 RepID=A0A0L0DEH3_THETB|nr:flagellar outer dynein arm-docking complex protein 1 [Thecamonas trahens ATCC 50062]KNC50556.1 flagellar outer dynein arm-docking complex protein 1 [Thecamonas trahens ATCC 50062]|eukprot:XP_013762446.1 flagellar outer dynein arm-docking complex protein 1 [Thecamonas trahens ATCC 50062]